VTYTEILPTCYELTLSHAGNGSDPSATPTSSTGCSAGEYVAGESISLSGAAPDSGWEIGGWSGTNNNGSTASTNTVTMPASAHAASVTYVQSTYTLTVDVVGDGDVTLDPAGGSYLSGTEVDLTAVADSGWTFTGWSGDLSGNTNPETITMDGDKTVTATFTDNDAFNTWVGSATITSDQAIVAVARPHVGDEVLTYNGFAGGSLEAYVPMMFKDAFANGAYDSALYVQNVDGSNTADITIRFYDSSGVETYSMTDTILPLASKGYWLPSISELGSSWVGGVKVESDQNIVAVGRPHINGQVLSYNGFAGGSLEAYVPMMFKDAFANGTYDSALYVQNVDTSNTANITVRYYDNSGAETHTMTDTIAPLASKGYWLPGISELGASWVGGVKVESDQEIVAVGRPHVGNQVLSYNGFAGGSLDTYVPMMFKDAFGGGSYDSALYVQNVDGSNTADITIRFYDSSGVETYMMTDTIAAQASKGYWLPSITPLGTSWVGGVRVESNQNIVAVGRPHVGSQVMTYNGFQAGSNNVYVPMLFKDAFANGTYDSALYIQNVDASNAADVTIRFYDVDGNLSCVVADSISALASKGWWLPGVTCNP
jgi:uncharacterized repeat protein (TIGR02543 family)